jgi:O-antigen ligase
VNARQSAARAQATPAEDVSAPLEQDTGRAEPASRSVLHALEIFVVLQLLLPTKLVVEPIGQVGSPATLWGLACLVWYAFALLYRDSGLRRGRQPVRWAILILLIVWLLSYLAMLARMAPAAESATADAALLHFLAWAGIALLAADGLRSVEQLFELCRFIVGATVVVAAVAILQFLGLNLVPEVTGLPGFAVSGVITSVTSRGSFARVAGTTTHPIEFATTIAMVLPLALQLVPWVRQRRRWQIMTVLIAIGVPISLSRSGFVGVAVGLAVLFVSWPARRRVRVLVAIAAMAVAIFVVVPGLLGTLGGYFTAGSSDNSITGRTDDYAVVAPMIDDSPIIGRGAGTFTPPTYRILDNQYLLALVETGVVGVVALMAFFLIPALVARDAWSRSRDPRLRDLARALFAAALVAMISAVTFDAFSFWTFSGMAFLLIGLCGAAWRLQREEPAQFDAPRSAASR